MVFLMLVSFMPKNPTSRDFLIEDFLGFDLMQMSRKCVAFYFLRSVHNRSV